MKLEKAIDLLMEKLEGKKYGKEYVVKECPFCGRTDGKFYINTLTGQSNCKHASCGVKTNATGLFQHLNIHETIEYQDTAKSPEVPQNAVSISKANVRKLEESDAVIVDYMQSRGISYGTMSEAGVGVSIKNGAMAFVTDIKGKTVGVTYRTTDKRFGMERGSEQHLWGMDTMSPNNTLYVTEGHVDCLTLREMGITNSVTAPNGANSHDWVDRDWDFLKKFEKIVLCFDNDEGGRNAITDLRSRLDFANLYELEYGDYNDINEMFMGDCEALYKTVRHPKEIVLDGFISLQNVSTEQGVTDELTTTGLAGFDQIFGGIGLHMSTVIMSESGAGKTTVMNNMIKGMIESGQKVACWSGELSNKMLKTWLYSTIGGEAAVETREHPFRKGDVLTSIKPEYEKKIDKIVDGKLFVYDGNKSNGFNMLKHFEYLHKRFGVKYFYVDNLSILDMSIKGMGQYEAESEFAKQFASFTRNNAVHLFMFAHPTKTSVNSDPNFVDSKGRVKPIERYTQQQVRGSATLVNLIHNVLVLCRAKAHEKAFMIQKIEQQLNKANQQSKIPAMAKMMEDEFSLMAYLVKNRSGGYMYEDTLFGYDKQTRRIYGLQTKQEDLAREILLKDESPILDGEVELIEEEFGYDEF